MWFCPFSRLLSTSLPESKEEALSGLRSIMVDRVFGDAGNEVVIEEFLEGEEVSVLAFSDGYTAVPLPPAQDHKRVFDGDQVASLSLPLSQ